MRHSMANEQMDGLANNDTDDRSLGGWLVRLQFDHRIKWTPHVRSEQFRSLDFAGNHVDRGKQGGQAGGL